MSITRSEIVERIHGDLTATLLASGDLATADGIARARQPTKPVLGIRIPQLRTVVRDVTSQLDTTQLAEIGEVAKRLWAGNYHEEELAACMLLGLTRTVLQLPDILRYARSLDNWLSVDELGGCVGDLCVSGGASVLSLDILRRSERFWARRLYVVGLIRPARLGIDTAEASRRVAQLASDESAYVTRATAWFLREVGRDHPEAVRNAISSIPTLPASVRREVAKTIAEYR